LVALAFRLPVNMLKINLRPNFLVPSSGVQSWTYSKERLKIYAPKELPVTK